jgi:hypothetical protein
MSNNFRDRRVTLPHDASLGDEPADVGAVSTYPTVSTADIVQGLVDRSANPRAMMVPRHGTDGWCEECQQPGYRPTQAGHPFTPMQSRVPGVHPSADDGRVHNFDPAIDSPGQDQTDIDDPEINSGRAEARFRQSSSRWVGFQQGQGPFPVPIDIDRQGPVE